MIHANAGVVPAQDDGPYRVAAAQDFVNSCNDNELRPHYLHQVCEMLADIGDVSQLQTAELAALVALLIPAHSRILTGRVRATSERDRDRVLRLVPHSQPTTQLSK